MMTWTLLRCVANCSHHTWRGTLYRTIITTSSQGKSERDVPVSTDMWEDAYQREVPRTMDEMGALLRHKVNSPPNSRILRVAVVGVPNAGKSTLINSLLNWRVVSVSSKVHTTQVNAKAVFNEGSTQIVFLDTPGLVTPQEVKKFQLNQNLLKDPELSLQEADMMAVMHDVSNKFTCKELHPRVIRLLTLYPSIPSILLLNKVDKLKSKQKLLDITRTLTEGKVGEKSSHHQNFDKNEELNKEKLIKKALLYDKKMEQRNSHSANIEHESVETDRWKENWKSDFRDSADDNSTSENDKNTSDTNKETLLGKQNLLMEQKLQADLDGRKTWPGFREVFMISALNSNGVEDFRNYLLSSACPGPWVFNQKVVTDQNPQEIALMTVREKFLEHFPHEIPYNLNFSIEYWDLTQSEVVNTVVKVGSKRQSLLRMLIRSVAKVAREAEQELRNTFRTEVKLRINIGYNPLLNQKTKHK